jgi:uncharacterized protein YlxP (DUF503 family)
VIVGAALVEIHVHASQSLKQKRGVVQSIKQRLRNRFNISVAEVGGQELWQRALLGLSAAGAAAEPVREVLSKAIDFVEELHLAEVLASEIEIVELPHAELDAGGPWAGDLSEALEIEGAPDADGERADHEARDGHDDQDDHDDHEHEA